MLATRTDEDDLAPNADEDVGEALTGKPAAGWFRAVQQQLAPTHCAICGEALTNVRSQEIGIGPICIQKLGRASENPPLVSEEAARAALENMPDPARTRLLEIGGGLGPDARWTEDGEVRRQMVQSGLWYGSYAASFGADQRETVGLRVDTALLLIACVEAMARGMGFDKVADRMSKTWSRELSKTQISFVDGPGGLMGVSAPYSPQFNEACRANKNLFPKFEKKGYAFIRYFQPYDLPEVVNILIGAFGDGLATNPKGNLVALPAMALTAPPKPQPPAPPPSKQTGEIEPYPPDVIRLGDQIRVPGGGMSVVQYINPGRQSVGVGPQKGRGYTFFSFIDVETINGKKVATDMNERRRAGAAQEGAKAPELLKLPREIPAGLMAHQLENIAFIEKWGRGLIADEPGLGKSASSIVVADLPCVVVCPSLLKVNWVREVTKKWRPSASAALIEGMHEPTELQKNADFVIINYDILHAHAEWLMKRGFKTLIADEAHYLKNLSLRWDKEEKKVKPQPGSPRRAVAFYYLQLGIDRLIMLTGTPILNRTKELYPLLHMLDPREWKDGYTFCIRYCAGHQQQIGRGKSVFNCNGRSNSVELHERINNRYMIRHTKALLDLPEKQRRSQVVSLSEAGKKEYRKASAEFLKWVEAQGIKAGDPKAVARALAGNALPKLTALREIAARGKVEAVVDWITTHFEGTGRPLVVMGHHRSAFQAIVTAVDALNADAGGANSELSRPIRYASVLGGGSQNERQSAIDRFQAGELDVIFYSIAIATGTTLTRAEETLFFERVWRPSDLVQAEDRIHRIGTKNTVTITYLDAEGTIDQKIAMLLLDKTKTAAGVIDGVDLDDDGASQLVLGEMFARSETPGGLTNNPNDDELVASDSWNDPL